MEFFRDSQIDFMKYRRYFVIVSLVVLLISVLAVFVRGKLNLGVDFAGGTQVTVKFRQPQEMNDLAGKRGSRRRMRRLFAKLLELQKQTGDTLDLASLYPQLSR